MNEKKEQREYLKKEIVITKSKNVYYFNQYKYSTKETFF